MGGFSPCCHPITFLKNSLCNKRRPLALIFTVLLFHTGHLLCLPFTDLNNKTERDFFDPVSIGDRIITRQQSAGGLHNDPDGDDVPESRAIDEKCGEGEGG
jgi:hypothetical protein